ncbi:MAG: SpoIID/LytB domain-containing protein, partial [Pyrinomonadaceae bacterium]
MRNFARTVIIAVLADSFLLPIAFAQQPSREESRPRRTQPQWPLPPVASAPVTITNVTAASAAEPLIRIALTTDARLAVISTTAGHLMNASDNSTTLVALDTARVRVEPHLLSPLSPAYNDATYAVMVIGSTSREEAEESVKEIKKASGEDLQVSFDTDAKTWGVIIGSRRSRDEAEELRARLDAAGIEATVSGPVNGGNQATPTPAAQDSTAKQNDSANKNSVRLVSKPTLPSRELIASSSNKRLFNSSMPVVFASDNEQTSPVRFNDRPYRGRIEVFTNLHGSLTVVNELGLEDYVRGVVANELSPGGYPALEALKAQAIAARTYALRNRGQFMSQGFDLLPTTRSQVYRGLTSENPLSSRAVDETRGLVATYNGEPINALYTSTCGGRTEDAENIFNDAVPYLRGRECAVEGPAALAPFEITTTRDPADLRAESNVPYARDVALLAVHGFPGLR